MVLMSTTTSTGKKPMVQTSTTTSMTMTMAVLIPMSGCPQPWLSGRCVTLKPHWLQHPLIMQQYLKRTLTAMSLVWSSLTRISKTASLIRNVRISSRSMQRSAIWPESTD
ncbi:hypothetical protein D3C80_1681430 [compost metagenome]